jgi:hypothetical protein
VESLLDFVSTSLFDAMPVGALMAHGRELAGNATGRSAEPVREGIEKRLEAAGIPVRIEPNRSFEVPAPAVRRSLGQRAPEVYFAQLFDGEETLLDLRLAGWGPQSPDATPTWGPRALWIRWDAGFLAGVRDLYLGFYRDDDAAYTRVVKTLGLGDAGELLRKHFGEGDQRAVRFDSTVFQTTFHHVFVRCRDEGIELHRNFLALGVYLATLYDLLEGLDEAFDVRSAFERAHP